jgi:hypothetical protein
MLRPEVPDETPSARLLRLDNDQAQDPWIAEADSDRSRSLALESIARIARIDARPQTRKTQAGGLAWQDAEQRLKAAAVIRAGASPGDVPPQAGYNAVAAAATPARLCANRR